VNVALNRPSYQISTYSDTYGTYSAAYANDGSHATDLLNGPCMATNMAEPNPWWAVDLGLPLYVHSVKFTNRENLGAYAVSSVSI